MLMQTVTAMVMQTVTGVADGGDGDGDADADGDGDGEITVLAFTGYSSASYIAGILMIIGAVLFICFTRRNRRSSKKS